MNGGGLTSWAVMLVALATGFPSALKDEHPRLATLRPRRAALVQRCRTCTDPAKRAALRSDLEALEACMVRLRTAGVGR